VYYTPYLIAGILPHNGRNITFRQMNEAVRATFNFASTFCFYVPNYSAGMLHKSYSKDTFDLEELSLHNGIEHDASLTRKCRLLSPDILKPSIQARILRSSLTRVNLRSAL
jgi:hypothetical protein